MQNTQGMDGPEHQQEALLLRPDEREQGGAEEVKGHYQTQGTCSKGKAGTIC